MDPLKINTLSNSVCQNSIPFMYFEKIAKMFSKGTGYYSIIIALINCHKLINRASTQM